jgi:hypothetical protein
MFRSNADAKACTSRNQRTRGRHRTFRIRGLGLSHVLLLGAISWGCSWEEDGNSSASWVTLSELDSSAQPKTASLGVLVNVASGGGSVVRVDIEGGTINDTGASSACFLGLALDQTNAFVIVVQPTAPEAFVTAVLGDLEVDSAAPVPEVASVEAGEGDIGEGGAFEGGSVPGRSADASASRVTPGVAEAGTPMSPVLFGFAVAGCTGVPFMSLGKQSALVVSIGRAPVAPELDATVGPADVQSDPSAEPDTSDTDATDESEPPRPDAAGGDATHGDFMTNVSMDAGLPDEAADGGAS